MLSHVEWNTNLETGIPVIDQQHRRIVEYINEMVVMRENQNSREEMSRLLDDLVEYTYSHFSFEEALMGQSVYDLEELHIRTHQAFRSKIDEYHSAFDQGEDVFEKVGELLINWLIHHIMHDDQGYVEPVKKMLDQLSDVDKDSWINETKIACFES